MPNHLHTLNWLPGLEIFEADIEEHVFGLHMHAEFAIGVILEGIGGYKCRGSSHILPVGSLSLMNPEEPHTGYAIDSKLQYSMLYASADAVERILGKPLSNGFREIGPKDRSLALTHIYRQISKLLMEKPIAWQLKTEELVYVLINHVFTHYASNTALTQGNEPRAIAMACALIDAHIDGNAEEKLSLSEIALEVNLHPNYLIRSFKQAKGITPHAWLLWRKVCRAKTLVVRGSPLVEVALTLGFYDQSHLIRHFRKIFGVTPSQIYSHPQISKN